MFRLLWILFLVVPYAIWAITSVKDIIECYIKEKEIYSGDWYESTHAFVCISLMIIVGIGIISFVAFIFG